MKLIILAAGKGVRMRHLTKETPKPMLRVLEKPIIGHIFSVLPKDISEVIVVTKYLEDQIKTYLGNEFEGIPVTYVEGSSKGVAHSFKNTRNHINKGERFMMIYGDEIPNKIDIENCLENKCSILSWEAEDPWNHGVLVVDKNNIVKEIEEKPKNPKSNLIVGGIIVLNDSIFDYYPKAEMEKELYLTDLIKDFIKNHEVKVVKSIQAIGGISTPEDILRVERLLQKQQS